jgi:MipA family protein
MTFMRTRSQMLFVMAMAVATLSKGQSTQAEAVDTAASDPPRQEPVEAPAPWGYVAGLSLVDAPPYPGAGFSDVKPRPLLSLRYGRWRLSTSRSTALMGFAADNTGAGASTDLFEGQRWRFGFSVRIDSGRRTSESPQLRGLPDIEQTLRARLSANYRLTPGWSYLSSVSQDVLSRGGGLVLRQGLGYSLPFKWADMPTEWTMGANLSWANRRQLKTRYGITAEQSQLTGLAAFEPGSDWFEQSAGVGLTTSASPRWVLFANYGWTRLLGDAASSPLTLSRSAGQWGLGVAYRCCR